MGRMLSQLISYIFHPLLFPTYGTLYIVLMCPYRFGHLSFRQTSLTVIVIFIFGFVFPVISLLILKQLDTQDGPAIFEISIEVVSQILHPNPGDLPRPCGCEDRVADQGVGQIDPQGCPIGNQQVLGGRWVEMVQALSEAGEDSREQPGS